MTSSKKLAKLLEEETLDKDDLLDLAEFLEQQCLVSLKNDPVTQVQVLLRACKSSREMREKIISSKMKMSERNLMLLLKKQGTSFFDLKDQVLKDRCLCLMQSGVNKASDLAVALGYCDQNYFYRVFKRWMKCSFVQFKHGGGGGAIALQTISNATNSASYFFEFIRLSHHPPPRLSCQACRQWM